MIGSPLARAKEAPAAATTGAWRPPSVAAAGARVDDPAGRHLEEILLGPAQENDGTFNLMGALRTSMATSATRTSASFHRAEVMVAPALQDRGQAAAARAVGRHGLQRPRRGLRGSRVVDD